MRLRIREQFGCGRLPVPARPASDQCRARRGPESVPGFAVPGGQRLYGGGFLGAALRDAGPADGRAPEQFGCYTQYHRIFADAEGTYLEYSIWTGDAAESGWMYVHQLVPGRPPTAHRRDEL